MPENQSQLTAETVVDELKKLVALNRNNINAALDQLEVPSMERKNAKEIIEGLLCGNETIFAELSTDLSVINAERDGKADFTVRVY